MRTDIGWLYLLAGAGAVGAAVAYKNAHGTGVSPEASLGRVVSGGKAIRHVDLRGDELAVALAPPLARLLATKGASLEERRARPRWSTTDAEFPLADRTAVDLTLLAVGPGKGILGNTSASRGEELLRWAAGYASPRAPVVLALAPSSSVAQEVAAARQRRGGMPPRVHLLLLRDLPLSPNGAPSMATAAAWAADIARATMG